MVLWSPLQREFYYRIPCTRYTPGLSVCHAYIMCTHTLRTVNNGRLSWKRRRRTRVSGFQNTCDRRSPSRPRLSYRRSSPKHISDQLKYKYVYRDHGPGPFHSKRVLRRVCASESESVGDFQQDTRDKLFMYNEQVSIYIYIWYIMCLWSDTILYVYTHSSTE